MMKTIKTLSVLILFVFVQFSYAQMNTHFVTTWKTDNLNVGSTNNTSIEIPTNSAYTYNYDVDWDNDGVFDQIGVTGNVTHDFGSIGIYTIRIRGDFPHFFSNYYPDRDKILSVDQWGNQQWQSMQYAFYGCSNLSGNTVDIPNLSLTTNMMSTFRSATSFNANISNWIVNNITDMDLLFANATIFNQNISNWNVGNVTSMTYMFWNAIAFDQDIGSWNIENVANTERMFFGATAFDQDIGSWDIQSLTNAFEMFVGATLSKTNYDALLIGWEDNPHNNNVNFHGGNSYYCTGKNARTTLDITDTWTIVDSGSDCDDDHFVTTWKTDNLNVGSTNNTSIEIPTNSTYTYNYDVDWNNDGVFNQIGITGNVTHDFGAIGIYTIRIRGDFPHFLSHHYPDRDKILSVDQWGNQQWKSMKRSFAGCLNISIVTNDIPDLSQATSLNTMFFYATNFNDYIGDWDVSTITNFVGMFEYASSYNQFIGNWDMSSAVSIQNIFRYATNFNQPLNNWDVSGITFFSNIFEHASSFNQPLSHWDVSNATGFYRIFSNATSFNQPLNNWDVSNVTNFIYSFINATNFNQPLNNWQLGSATSMTGMFYNATSFNQDISSWNISNVSYLDYVFKNATNFNQPIGSWNTSSIISIAALFDGASSFNQDLSTWDFSNISNAYNAFKNSGLSSKNYDSILEKWEGNPHQNNVTLGALGVNYCNAITARANLIADGYTITDAGTNCESTYFVTTWETTAVNETITIPTEPTSTYLYDVDWDGDSIFDTLGETGDFTHLYPTIGIHTIKIRGTFPRIYFNNGGDKAKIHEVNQWGSQKWTSMESSFTNCSNLEITALDTPNLSLSTSMRYMFWHSYQINTGLENWDVSTITDMRNVFSAISNFNGDLSNWDTSSASNMFEMFSGCSSFNQNIGNWNVGNVTVMYNMFSGCTSFNQNIGNWNTSSLSNARSMFSGCTSFNQNIGNWNTLNISDMRYMFYNTTSFNQNLENWDIGSLTQADDMFFGVTLDTRNYDALLNSWRAQGPNNGVTFSGGNSKYCDGIGARTLLFIVNGWAITDGGLDCEGTYFVTTWETTTPNETITIPTDGISIYNYDVDWDGDSTFDTIGITGDAISPPYAIVGNHTVKIRGTFPRIIFNNTGDKNKILSIDQWGSQKWSSMQAAFYGCTNLEELAIDSPDLSMCNSLYLMFAFCSSLNQDINNWDVSTITNMISLFNGASRFNKDLNNWDVSSVTRMDGMFSNTTDFNKNIGNWNVANVINMRNMFHASAFNLDINNWNTSKVTNMSSMFYSASDFNQNINDWDTSKVTNMSSMFLAAIKYNQPLNQWNVAKVTDMFQMFRDANTFDQPLNQWNVANVTNMRNMFLNAWLFNQNTNNWNVGKVSSMNNMFNNARMFNQPLNHWNVSKVTNMSYMFKEAFSFNQTLNNWDTSLVVYMDLMFYTAYDFDSPIGNWNVGNVINMSAMFGSTSAFNPNFNQDISNWDVSKVTQMANMFNNSTSFNQDISSWDVGLVVNMSSMFNRATAFNNGNQSLNWNDTSKVTNMNAMFLNATSFDQNIGSWDISSLTNASSMFFGVTLSRDNYDSLLIGWQANPHQPNVTFSGGNSKYCLGESARETLDITNTWTITDGGKYCDDCTGTPITFNGSWSGTPNLLSPVTINANYDTNIHGNFTSCNCTINNGFTVNVKDGNFISTNDLTNNGNLIIDNNGSFIQNSNTSSIGGTGYFKMDRETTPYVEYDYTYWSSPTNQETISSVFNSNSSLISGASHVNAVNDDDFSPANRIYRFNAANFNDTNNDTFDDEGDDWQVVNSATIMNKGEGYIAMGSGADFPFNSNFAPSLQQKVFFEGEFNNGNINKIVYTDNSSTDTSPNLNLIGNPYPSAIDINKLMKSNITRLGGTFYFWTHDSPISGVNPGPNAFDFTNNDYAIATSNGTVFNYISNGSNTTTARPYIATAQSVMVNVLNQGNITFNNDMRINTPNASYRPANQPNLDRLWLNLTNQTGVFRQLLVTFYQNGNDVYENGLDGERPNNGTDIDFFSIINNDNRRFAIQTVGNFDSNKTIPLGIEIVNSGTYKISLDSMEGLFNTGQDIFIQDNENQTIHNLSNSDYTFYIDATSELRSRFVLRFNNATASLDDTNIFSSISIYPNPSKNGIFNISTDNKSLLKYSITDITGKIIRKNKKLSNNSQIDLSNLNSGIYLIIIDSENKQVIKKLIIM